MKTTDIWVHVVPRFEDDHELEDGAQCWCEPVVEIQMHAPESPYRFLLCLHCQEFLDVTAVIDGPDDLKGKRLEDGRIMLYREDSEDEEDDDATQKG